MDEMLAALDAAHAEINRLQKSIALNGPAEEAATRAVVEAEIVAWLRWYANEFPSFDDYFEAADAIERGEHREKR